MDFQQDLQNSYWTWDNCSFHESAHPPVWPFQFLLVPTYSPITEPTKKKNLSCKPSECPQGAAAGHLGSAAFYSLHRPWFFNLCFYLCSPNWAWTALPPILPAIYLPACILPPLQLLPQVLYMPSVSFVSALPQLIAWHAYYSINHTVLWLLVLCMSPLLEWELPEDSTYAFSTHRSLHCAWYIVVLHRWSWMSKWSLLFRYMGQW